MKKRVISTMLALALVLGLLPAVSLPVFAATPTLFVAGTEFTTYPGVSYDAASHTLTLTNVDINVDADSGLSSYTGIEYLGSEDLNLVLVGDNRISMKTGVADATAIRLSDGVDLTVTGSGTLSMTSFTRGGSHVGSYCIRVINGDLILDGAKITANSGFESNGAYGYALFAENIYIKNGSEVTAFVNHNGTNAISGQSADVSIPIYAEGGTEIVIQDSNVCAYAGPGQSISAGIGTHDKIIMDGGNILAQGEDMAVYTWVSIDLNVPTGSILTTKTSLSGPASHPTAIADTDWENLKYFAMNAPSSGGSVPPGSSDPPVVAIPMYWPILETGPGGRVSVTPLAGSEGATMTLIVKPGTGRQVASITARDAGGNDVPVSLREDGRYFFIQPDSRVTVTTTFTDRCYSSEYSDLDLEAWYHEATDFVLEKGYMIGTGDSIFDPYGLLDRSQVVTVLWRLEGSPENSDSIYTDVTADDWYLAPLGWATGRDLALGFGDGTFGPTQAVTLEQLAAFLYRYVQYKAGETEIVTGLDAAMEWARQEGLLEGMEGITTPDAPALRVQIAHMLLKVLGK